MNQYIVVIDFETGGIDPHSCEVVQLSAVAIDKNKLEICENGEFNSLIKPLDPTKLDPKAMEVNKIALDRLENAPHQKLVMEQFSTFLKRFSGTSEWHRPIISGYNIYNFDYVILNRLCVAHGYVKNNKNTLFHPREILDLLPLSWSWFFQTGLVPDMKLTTLANFLGLDTSGAHNAIVDCQITSKILCRILKFHKEHAKRETFYQKMKG